MKNGLNKKNEHNLLEVQKCMDAAKESILKGELNKAEEVLEDLVSKFESAKNLLEYDENTEYYTFREFVEKVLYKHISNTTKNIKIPGEDFGTMYFMYGSLLFELKKYEECRVQLEKAIKWNPLNIEARFEYAEILKVSKEYQKFYDYSKEILEYAYYPSAIARVYRNIAFYFIEMGELYKAKIFIYISLKFDPKNNNALRELKYIAEIEGQAAEEPSMEEAKKVFEETGISWGPSTKVLNILYRYGKHFNENKKYQKSKYFFNYLYKITGDSDVKEIIESFSRK